MSRRFHPAAVALHLAGRQGRHYSQVGRHLRGLSLVVLGFIGLAATVWTALGSSQPASSHGDTAILSCDVTGTGGDRADLRGIRFAVDQTFVAVELRMAASVAGGYNFTAELRRSTGFLGLPEATVPMFETMPSSSTTPYKVIHIDFPGAINAVGSETFTLKFSGISGQGFLYIEQTGFINLPCAGVEETEENDVANPMERSDPAGFKVLAMTGGQCGIDLPIEEFPKANVTLVPSVGLPGSQFQVQLTNATQNNFGDEPAEALWDWDLQPPADLVGNGTIPKGETQTAFGATVPQDAEPGAHHVTVCWRRNLSETWYFKQVEFDVPQMTPTLTPTATPTATPTPTPPLTPTPTATPTPPPGPVAVEAAAFKLKPVFEIPDVVLVPNPDPHVTAIEVTQSIQCMDNTQGDTNCDDNEVPLVKDRFTWVRVYLRSSHPIFNVSNVPLRLTIKRNNTDYLTLNATGTARAAIDRNNIDHTVNFIFLCSACNNGNTLNFRVQVDPDNVITEANEANQFFPAASNLNLNVYTRRSLDITALRMRYNPPGPTDVTVPTSEASNQIWYLVRALPVPHLDPVSYTQGGVYTWNQSYNTTSVINALNTAYVTSGAVSAPDQVILFVPGETGFDNGISNPLWGGGQGVVTLVDVDRYPDGAQPRVVAHEISHNLGRRHPCTSNSQTDPSWPYTGGGVAGLDYSVQETGVETDVSVFWLLFIPIPVFSPIARADTQTEMMQGGHCGFVTENNSNVVRWVTPYTYQQIFCALSPTAATSLSCRQGNAVAIGSTGIAAINPAAVASGPAVLVSGAVQADGSGASIGSVYRLDDAEADSQNQGSYCIDLEDAGKAVATRCWEPEFDLPEGPADLESVGFGVILPWSDGVDRIVLRRGTEQLDSTDISASAPSVAVTSPSTGGLKGGIQTVEWTASDPDDDSLLFSLMYSADGGSSFTPIAADLTGTSYQVDLGALPGGDDAFFRVMATDNAGHSPTADSAHFEVANKPPTATINAPDDGSPVLIGDPVALSGTGSDLEDDLQNNAYTWTSSIDGSLGSGPAYIVSNLSPGNHTITLRVADTDGLIATDSIRLFVGLPAQVDVQPDAVSPAAALALNGITVYAEIPYGYDVNGVDQGSLVLHVGNSQLAPTNVAIGDFDADGLADLTLMFDEVAFRGTLTGQTDPAIVTLGGTLDDGTPFQGSDVVGLTIPGDVDCSGEVNSVDALMVLRSIAGLGEPACASAADVDCSGSINSVDALGILRHVASLPPLTVPQDCPPLGGAAAAALPRRGIPADITDLARHAWVAIALVVPGIFLRGKRRPARRDRSAR